MNSKFPNDFRWSIRLTGDSSIYIGIAAKELQRERTFVGDYDEFAIIYFPSTGKIYKNGREIDYIKGECGGEIHFRCQPKQKKFSLAINDTATVIDMDDLVIYFPVIGAVPSKFCHQHIWSPTSVTNIDVTAWSCSATLFKPQVDCWA